jgi:hypothetical protein
MESGLQAGAERVEVELDDVGWGCYCVGGEEDVLLEEESLAYVYASGDQEGWTIPLLSWRKDSKIWKR